MVKLHENRFRAVNIALANETSLLCDRLGVNVWDVIDAAIVVINHKSVETAPILESIPVVLNTRSAE